MKLVIQNSCLAHTHLPGPETKEHARGHSERHDGISPRSHHTISARPTRPPKPRGRRIPCHKGEAAHLRARDHPWPPIQGKDRSLNVGLLDTTEAHRQEPNSATRPRSTTDRTPASCINTAAFTDSSYSSIESVAFHSNWCP